MPRYIYSGTYKRELLYVRILRPAIFIIYLASFCREIFRISDIYALSRTFLQNNLMYIIVIKRSKKCIIKITMTENNDICS